MPKRRSGCSASLAKDFAKHGVDVAVISLCRALYSTISNPPLKVPHDQTYPVLAIAEILDLVVTGSEQAVAARHVAAIGRFQIAVLCGVPSAT